MDHFKKLHCLFPLINKCEKEVSNKYICHVVDQFTKFHCLFPLINKCSKEVSKGSVARVLSIIGLPTILHSDNGKEFVNDIIKATLFIWPDQCNIVNGNPGQTEQSK